MRKRHSLLPKVNRRTTGAEGLSGRAQSQVAACSRLVMCHRRLEGESKQGMADEMYPVPDTGFI